MTYPSSLVGNPFGYTLCADELDNKAYDFGEEASYTPLYDCDRHPVTKAQQGHHTTPVDVPVTEQSVTK